LCIKKCGHIPQEEKPRMMAVLIHNFVLEKLEEYVKNMSKEEAELYTKEGKKTEESKEVKEVRENYKKAYQFILDNDIPHFRSNPVFKKIFKWEIYKPEYASPEKMKEVAEELKKEKFKKLYEHKDKEEEKFTNLISSIPKAIKEIEQKKKEIIY